MANISDEVQIETRTEHELSNQFQSVMGDQSFNVGTLLSCNDSSIEKILVILPANSGQASTEIADAAIALMSTEIEAD